MSLALGYSFVARSDEIFASSSGVVHPRAWLRRSVVPGRWGSGRPVQYDFIVFRAGSRRPIISQFDSFRSKTSLHWHQATSIEVRFRGHKRGQVEIFVARSDEIFASSSGVVHPVHCLDVALHQRVGQRPT